MATRLTLEEKLLQLQDLMGSQDEDTILQFQTRLDMSWIFHDSALEGTVLSGQELKSAIDKDVVSDVSLIPTYEEIRAHKAAIDFVRELAHQKKKTPLSVELLLKIRDVLSPPDPILPAIIGAPSSIPGVPVLLAPDGTPLPPPPVPVTPPTPTKDVPWRKDTPVHRLYFHDIPSADKIPGEMKKLNDWLADPETKKLSALRLASKLHFKLMTTYPFAKNTGKLARLMMNLVLLRAGYPPAIIHSTERQRYYEALKGPSALVYTLMLDSLENAIDSAVKMFTEAQSGRRAMA